MSARWSEENDPLADLSAITIERLRPPQVEYLSRFYTDRPVLRYPVKVRRNSPSLELHIEIPVTCHELARDTRNEHLAAIVVAS